MKVNCIFDGGLGNQLFQYAFAFALKHQLRGSTLEAVTSLVTKRYPRRDYYLRQLGLEIPECRMDIQRWMGVFWHRSFRKRIPVISTLSGDDSGIGRLAKGFRSRQCHLRRYLALRLLAGYTGGGHGARPFTPPGFQIYPYDSRIVGACCPTFTASYNRGPRAPGRLCERTQGSQDP